MIEKTFLNPATNKQWRIEIDGHTIRTCLNGGKVKEILCDSAFQVRSKAASAMMGQMRKGFVYQNRDAAVGQARCHRFVGKDSNGFMPLAASPARDDFFLTRVVGDFEDETLYHFDGSGESLETVSLGAKRMTYEQVLCPNDTLLLNNSYLLQQFSLRTHEVTPFANKKNSMKTMLDVSGDLALWYTGEEIVVFAFGSNTKVWRETVKCKKSKDPNFAYWDITDEEYLAQLETKREEITHEILERCRTKRKNLYITGPVALNVAQKFSVHRLCDKEGKHNLANRFVGELMEQLVQDGLLVTTKTRNGPGVRTATDAEISSPLPGQQQMTL